MEYVRPVSLPQRGMYAPSLSASFVAARPNASTAGSFTTVPLSWSSSGTSGEVETVELRISHAAAAAAPGGFGHGCTALPCVLMVGVHGYGSAVDEASFTLLATQVASPVHTSPLHANPPVSPPTHHPTHRPTHHPTHHPTSRRSLTRNRKRLIEA